MDEVVGKKVDIIMEDLWNANARITGELVSVDQRGWLVKTKDPTLPQILKPLCPTGEERLVYVPQRLILLASFS